MIRLLVFQFSHIDAAAEAELQTFHKQHQNGSQQPNMYALEQTLRKMISGSPRTPIILDALDECQTREPLLNWLKDARCRVLLTSRGLEDISYALGGWFDSSCMVDAQGREVVNDIAAYVQHRLQSPDSKLAETWKSRPDVLHRIEAKIKRQSNGMFRWAACQLQALEAFKMPIDLLRALDSLPKTLSETYKRILGTIPESDRKLSRRLLSFLTYSQRPLTISEAVDILAITFEETPEFHPDYRMPRPERVLRFCSSLVTLTEDDQLIRLAHFSVKEYLTSNEDKGDFSHALKPPMAQENITAVLLAYLMSFNEYENILSNILTRGKMRPEFPLIDYAADHWLHHAMYVPETSISAQQWIVQFVSIREARDFRHPGRIRGSPIRIGPLVGGHHPLYGACLRGLYHTARYLLEQGADINAYDGRLGPPLRAACCKGHSKVAKLLIQWGAEVDIQLRYRETVGTALMPAIMNDMVETVYLLLEGGADPNCKSPTSTGNLSSVITSVRPLNAASENGSVEIVSALLDHGADVQFMDSRKGTALMGACYRGHTAVAELLINSGAIVDSVAKHFELVNDFTESCTALILASVAGHVETVKLLIDKGADADRLGGHDTILTVARSRDYPDFEPGDESSLIVGPFEWESESGLVLRLLQSSS